MTNATPCHPPEGTRPGTYHWVETFSGEEVMEWYKDGWLRCGVSGRYGPEEKIGKWIYIDPCEPPGAADWQPIETAPKDGTWIQAIIPGHGADNIIAWLNGLLDTDGDDCGGWSFVTEQEPPDCWSDGVCWEHNADGVPSVIPTHWRPLPAPPKVDGNDQ